MDIRTQAKRMVGGSPALLSLLYITDNYLARIGIDLTSQHMEGELDARDVDAASAYIQGVFDGYKRKGGVSAFHGRVAEVGGAGNPGVPLLIRADGATAVDMVDRYPYAWPEANLQATYLRLGEQRPAVAALLEAAAGDLEQIGLKAYAGPLAAAETFFSEPVYDFIVSQAVMEHVRSPALSLSAMARALRPGGMMLHQVDLRDHGMYSAYGHGDLFLLRSPPWLHRAKTSFKGRPNRSLLPTYRRALEQAGLQYEIKVTDLFGVGSTEPLPYPELPAEAREQSLAHVRAEHERMDRSVASVSLEDLSVSSFFLCARKA